jgi:3-oxoacyl-[acyl-carrier protein] reductase
LAGRLDGKIAVVTGAGGGLGRETSVRFAQEGARVVCQDLDEGAAKATADAIASAGGPDTLVWSCDVSDSTAIDAMFAAATDRLGVVDVLVSNAGVDHTPGDAFEDGGVQLALMSDAGWQRMLDIHLNGAFYCSRAMVRGLVEAKRGGSIICMSSVAGTSGWGPVHYATAKAGLLGFVRSIARMLGGLGIRANAICPGVIDTAMTRNIPSAMIDGLRLLTPLGRVGEPADIAAAAVYLAGDESAFVTGQAISPNGGLVIA